MFRGLRRYHLTMGCVCHPERVPLHVRTRLGHIPGECDLMAARICRTHDWRPTRVVARFNGHEDQFTFVPVWHGRQEHF